MEPVPWPRAQASSLGPVCSESQRVVACPRASAEASHHQGLGRALRARAAGHPAQTLRLSEPPLLHLSPGGRHTNQQHRWAPEHPESHRPLQMAKSSTTRGKPRRPESHLSLPSRLGHQAAFGYSWSSLCEHPVASWARTLRTWSDFVPARHLQDPLPILSTGRQEATRAGNTCSPLRRCFPGLEKVPMCLGASTGSFPPVGCFHIPTSKIQSPEDLLSINNVPTVPRSPSYSPGTRPEAEHKQSPHLSDARVLVYPAPGEGLRRQESR